MAAIQFCQRCATGQRPEAYVVSLAGSCCKCGIAAKESSHCGSCSEDGNCAGCGEFNGYFELKRTDSDCCCYEYEFPKDNEGKTPCGATKIQMRLSSHHDSDKANVCVLVAFDQSDGSVRPVSWGKAGVADCCQIGKLRRRTTNSKCCWPHEVTVTPVPTPDFVVPKPEWCRGDPDDLNDSPFWPALDMPLATDSPEVPVRLFNGELQLRIKDVGADGYGAPWGHTRIYSNRLSNSYDCGNGYNWLIHEMPQLVRCKSSPEQIKLFHDPAEYAKPTGCTVVLLRGTRNALWFDQFRDAAGTSSWKPRLGAKHALEHEDKKDYVFRLVAPNGHVWEFFDFTHSFSKGSRSRFRK